MIVKVTRADIRRGVENRTGSFSWPQSCPVSLAIGRTLRQRGYTFHAVVVGSHVFRVLLTPPTETPSVPLPKSVVPLPKSAARWITKFDETFDAKRASRMASFSFRIRNPMRVV